MSGLLSLMPLVQGMAYIGVTIGVMYQLAPAEGDAVIGAFPSAAALAQSCPAVVILRGGTDNG